MDRAIYNLVQGNVFNLLSLCVTSDTYSKLLVHCLLVANSKNSA